MLDGTNPVIGTPEPITICVSRDLGRRDIPEVRYVREQLDPADVVFCRGLPVATPLRTSFDTVRDQASLTEAVVVMDMAAHALGLGVDELAACCVGRRGVRGVARVREALSWVDPASASPWESRLRMFYRRRAGLPRPLVNRPVFDLDGQFLGTPDLLDDDAGLVTEFDGQDHRERRQHRADNLREERLEEANLVVCRVDSLDLRYPQMLADRLAARFTQGQARDRRRDRWTLHQPDWWSRRRIT